MAKVDPDKDGKYKLGGSKDTDLEGIDSKKYDVFTETEKLGHAQRDYPNYSWFASYLIKDKNGNEVRTLPEYTIKIDKPASGEFQLYYYLNGTTYPFPHEDTDDKGSKKRVKAKLTIGDPPTGSVP
jgi:hypothetical protein